MATNKPTTHKEKVIIPATSRTTIVRNPHWHCTRCVARKESDDYRDRLGEMIAAKLKIKNYQPIPKYARPHTSAASNRPID